MKHRCPVCHKTVRTSVQGKSEESSCFPFCSQRCKLIDLGAWLDAEYKIISKPQSEEYEELSETPSTPINKI
jgi:endogenous inhibitor of DNA gyrase (YacG/DUF329 family)